MDSLSGNEIYTTSAGLESNLIELAGGINTTKGMSDSRWFTTSVETLVTANQDVIIFNDYVVEGQVQENMDFITNNAALADVPAVKNQNYVVVPLAYVMHDLSAVVACQDFAEAFYQTSRGTSVSDSYCVSSFFHGCCHIGGLRVHRYGHRLPDFG